MKRIIKVVKLSLLLVCAGLTFTVAALFFSEQQLPASLVGKLTDSISTSNMLVRADSISIRLPHRVRVRNLRVFDRTSVKRLKPVISADCVDMRLTYTRIPLSWRTIVKSVSIEKLYYPRLPEGYYIPDSIEFPGSPDFKEVNEPLELDLPQLAPFSITLLQPDILAVRPEKVFIPAVSVAPRGIRASDISLAWPDKDADMSLKADFAFDLDEQMVRGNVRGLARQHHIRPMLEALDITNSYQFIDGFTGVVAPVDAGCAFEVNLRNNDLRIRLDLNPTGGAYHEAAMKNASGKVDVRVFVRDTYQNAHIHVGPIGATMADGGTMNGSVFYENTNDIGYVSFEVDSITSLSNALAVADVMNDGTLDCLQCETLPHLTLRGRLAVDPTYAATNNIFGTVAFDKGTFFGLPLHNASVSYQVDGTSIDFKGGHAKTPHGGGVFGTGNISVPEFKQELASFTVNLRADGVPLEDLASAFSKDVGGRHGKVNAKITLSGPLSEDLSSRINGRGSVSCADGQLAQMKLFAGFTEYLAEKVPGVASLVNQSNGSMDFTISNGVINVSRLIIEGDVFSIRGSGTYSIPADNLDFAAHVQLFRNDSIVSKLTSPIIWPFSKLLMEFKVFGPLDNPNWKYLSVLERLK